MCVLSGELCMLKKMLNSLCLPWAVLCAWTHLPLFSEPFQFCALLFIIIIMVVITLMLLPIFFFLSSSWFCSLLTCIAHFTAIVFLKKEKNLSPSSSALLSVLWHAPLLDQPLHFHCCVLQPLLSTHGLHHFFHLT